MTKLCTCGFALLVLLSRPVFGQQDIPGTTYVFRPNQEVRVPGLPSIKAKSSDSSDVLLASLETIFQSQSKDQIKGNEVCCGSSSALEDVAASADPLSLPDLASRLQGRHLLSDGRPIEVTAHFLPASLGDVGYRIIGELMDKHALLMVWNAHLYVLCGAVFDESLNTHGTKVDSIRKIMLLDPRFSDSRRELVFNRETDDWNNVEGMLWLTFAPQ